VTGKEGTGAEGFCPASTWLQKAGNMATQGTDNKGVPAGTRALYGYPGLDTRRFLTILYMVGGRDPEHHFQKAQHHEQTKADAWPCKVRSRILFDPFTKPVVPYLSG
jgi:hypothetical protein